MSPLTQHSNNEYLCNIKMHAITLTYLHYNTVLEQMTPWVRSILVIEKHLQGKVEKKNFLKISLNDQNIIIPLWLK